MTLRTLLCVALAVQASVAVHMVELQKRPVPAHEQHELLQLLQTEAGTGDEVPNIRLNSNFFGKLMIGDTQQEFEVVFDTGSDALWVYSDSCLSCKQAKKHVYSRPSSGSYRIRNTPFAIRYGTGESHGTTGTDVMRLGDLEVTDQVFGQCDQPDDVMRSFPFDGIVGLSRPMFMDPNGLVPIMDTVKKEGVLTRKNLADTFAFYLGREETDKSYLIFGGSHDVLHEGILHWVPTLSKNIFWELPLDDILIHEKPTHGSQPQQPISLAHETRTLERELEPVRHSHSHRRSLVHPQPHQHAKSHAKAHEGAVHDSFARLMSQPSGFAFDAQDSEIIAPSLAHHTRKAQHSSIEQSTTQGEYSLGTDDNGDDQPQAPSTAQLDQGDDQAELEQNDQESRDLMLGDDESNQSDSASTPVDPFENAPRATLIGSDSAELEESSAAASPFSSEATVPLPGQSLDGYQFTTVATPVFLELQATVAKRHRTTKHVTALNTKLAPRSQRQVRSLEQSSDAQDLSEVGTGNPLLDNDSNDALDEALAAPDTITTQDNQPSGEQLGSNSNALEEDTSATANLADSQAAPPVAMNGDSVVGNGQLLSDVGSVPGFSIRPCQQDSNHPCVVSLDSGHSLISGPPELVRKLKEYTMPPGACTEEATQGMPDVSFVLGGKLFTLNPMDYLIELEGQCTPAFRERPFRNGHDWVLGEHFMRTFYTVFNYDDMRVGLSRVDTIKDHLDTIMTPHAAKKGPQ